ncbi:MAG: cobalamin-dependent protein [Candidatus Krumholzibacteriota bacterium]|nr:cobalamin-dependent protein [Candidatus Krumholzibacteriota bacterium]
MPVFLDECAAAVLAGDGDAAASLARRALEEGRPLMETIDDGFIRGIRDVGRLWEEGELFLPELVMGAEAMKRAMAVLVPALGGKAAADPGKAVVIGTIEGDIHDIGKTLVATMLSANGYAVVDLGADVPAARFADEAAATGARVVCVSALLTTTMAGQRAVVEELVRRGLRETVRVVVGGAPVSADWAREIGADGYAPDAVAAVDLLDRLGEGERRS